MSTIKSKEVAERLHKCADYMESLPDFECDDFLTFSVTPTQEKDVESIAKARKMFFHQGKLDSTMCTTAVAGEETAGIALYLSTYRKLKPEEYPRYYKDKKALAAKQYLSNREQAMIDFIRVMAFNGVSRKQAERIYETIATEFKLVPLTDEEKKISHEAKKAEQQK